MSFLLATSGDSPTPLAMAKIGEACCAESVRIVGLLVEVTIF